MEKERVLLEKCQNAENKGNGSIKMIQIIWG